jgi:hypothetical protein
MTLTGVLGGHHPDVLCSALSGMNPMYLLMSAFHSPPWLKLNSATKTAPARLTLR